MKVYLGGPFDMRDAIKELRGNLHEHPINLEVLAPFLDLEDGVTDETATPERMREEAFKNLRGIVDSDVVAIVQIQKSTRGGAFVELGFATALKKPVILCLVDTNKMNPFMHLPNVHVIQGIDSLMVILKLLAHRELKYNLNHVIDEIHQRYVEGEPTKK